MKIEQKDGRRGFIQKVLGTTGILTAGGAMAQLCPPLTARQPLGPFYPDDGTPVEPVRESEDGPIALANDNDLTTIKGKSGKAVGTVVEFKGVLTDAACNKVAGANIIIWQASSTGAYNHLGDSNNESFPHPVTGEMISRNLDPSFQYWGKDVTKADGSYSFKTIVPGFYPADLSRNWYRPPHIHVMVSVLGREPFVTQMYFRGEDLPESSLNEQLLKKDFLLQDPNISDKQRESVIVDFALNEKGMLSGIFNIALDSWFSSGDQTK